MEDLDQETINMIISYGRCDPRIAQDVEVVVLEEYDSEWNALDFKKLIVETIETIPSEYRESAVVHLNEYGAFRILYHRLQNSEEVAASVSQSLEYVKKRQAVDRETYERLKKKFEEK